MLALLVVMVMMGTVPVFAEDVVIEGSGHGDQTISIPTGAKDAADWAIGAKADAPNLIRLTDNLHIGGEVTKDLHHTSADEGWGVYAKVTYTGCFINCK